MWDSTIVPIYCSNYLNDFTNNNIDKCKYYLENITKTNLTYGYDLILENGCDNLHIINKTFIKLLKELDIDTNLYIVNELLDFEAILPLLDERFGFFVDFPSIFDYSNNASLTTSRGKISSRMVYALYYVYNITKCFDDYKNISVLEIGAGTGRTAYYAYKFGFKNYSIIDIISTGIVQAHYNFNVLGLENVCLYDEIDNNSFLKIIPSTKLNDLNDKYDIVVNFDGLTEYGLDIATNYFNKIMNITNKFLSINHTSNQYSIQDLYKNKSNIQLITREECDYRIDSTDLKYYKEIILFL
jgi:hypothetical protein